VIESINATGLGAEGGDLQGFAVEEPFLLEYGSGRWPLRGERTPSTTGRSADEPSDINLFYAPRKLSVL